MKSLQPIYLFADSQLLFWRKNQHYFLRSIVNQTGLANPRVAYIGASNGDRPEFYELFRSALANIGVMNCQMIRTAFPEDDQHFLATANIILLAGGNVAHGWRIFQKLGWQEILTKRYFEGSLLIGISAGAIQLGYCGWSEGEISKVAIFNTLNLVPAIIGVHSEKDNWSTLKKIIMLNNRNISAIGIPGGAGLVYHSNQTIEPIRYPLQHLYLQDNQLIQQEISKTQLLKRFSRN